MPAILPCPNTKCDHPGPLGFNDPVPWGQHFYHTGDCPGAWRYDGQWYDTEAQAYTAWKRGQSLDPDWEAAFDARILRRDMAAYNRLIQVWRDKH